MVVPKADVCCLFLFSVVQHAKVVLMADAFDIKNRCLCELINV